MNTVDRIHEQVQHLPESAQHTVLDFVEQLAQRLRRKDHDWASRSLQAAPRGMENDVWPEYSEMEFNEKWTFELVQF
jgi:hypothetical protein